ncbi:MAG: transcription antitermination factor NusB [Acidobacteriota bacterium]
MAEPSEKTIVSGPDARAVALRILRRVREERRRASPLLAAVRRQGIAGRELRLVTEIVYGTLRWKLALEAAVLRLCRRKPPAPEIADVLHLALYQMLLLTRVPAHAAVNRAVDQARALGGAPAASFVNAVLRRAGRIGQALLEPKSTDEAERLAFRYAHPVWLVRRWRERWGAPEVEALLAFNQQVPEVSLWPTPDRGDLVAALRRSGVDPEPAHFVPGALRARGGSLAFSPLHEDGAFTIQDEASQLVCWLFERPLRGAVLDLCAGTGGKTAQLAGWSTQVSLLVASDRNRAALQDLRSRFRRLRLPLPLLLGADWETGQSLRARFSTVLLDAPCTGTGVLRRRPEIKLRLQLCDVHRLARLQERLLEVAAGMTAPRGQLVYAVCSLEQEEGAHRVDEFLRRHPEFKRAAAGSCFPRSAGALLDRCGDLVTLPWRDRIDGFYACRLMRHT